jgi:hypothetical protein
MIAVEDFQSEEVVTFCQGDKASFISSMNKFVLQPDVASWRRNGDGARGFRFETSEST